VNADAKLGVVTLGLAVVFAAAVRAGRLTGPTAIAAAPAHGDEQP
jgi:hypothetical protein